MLPQHDLLAGNALQKSLIQLTTIAGPAMAGIVLPLAGLSTLYLCDTILLSGALVFMRGLGGSQPNSARKVGNRSVMFGFRYIVSHKFLLTTCLVEAIAIIFGMPRALFPQISHEVFGDPISGGLCLGVLYSSLALGSLIGGFFSGWIAGATRQGLVMVLCSACWGSAIGIFGVAINLHFPLFVAAATLSAAGAANMLAGTVQSTILQNESPEELRGRVQGAFMALDVGSARLGDMSHGLSSSVVGLYATLAWGGILVILVLLLAITLLPGVILGYRKTIGRVS
jgi:hypothetical protein